MLKRRKSELGLALLAVAFSVFVYTDFVSAASINMTVSSSIATDILPTNPNGTEGSSSTTASNISITTDNFSGYTLSLTSTSATAPALTGDNGSIPSITAEKETISAFNSGAWGYKPTKKNGENWDNLAVISGATNYTSGYFLPAPTTTSDMIDKTDVANSAANEYNIAVATKIGSETKIGSYSGTFTVVAVTNPMPSYTIAYDLAGGVAGTDAPTTGTYDTDFTVSNPSRAGYIFTGWGITGMDTTMHYYGASSSDYQTSNDTTLEDITATWYKNLRSSAGTVTFTANWEKACIEIATDTCLEYMQDMDTAAKTAMKSEQAYFLKDKRDNEEYLVAKLKDGKVWMLDNLRLGGDTAIELKTTDTNIVTDWTLPASGSWVNSYTAAYINSASKTKTVTSYGLGSGKVGVYYNYCAATAGTYCYSSSFSTGNAEHDICPANWRMPTDGGSGEYQVLYQNYSSSVPIYNAALSTPLSGYFDNGSAKNHGVDGYFWSSTRNSNTLMYILYASPSATNPTGLNFRYYGFSVRCVAQ